MLTLTFKHEIFNEGFIPQTRGFRLLRELEFAAAAFDLDYKAFVIYIVALNISFYSNAKVYPFKKV